MTNLAAAVILTPRTPGPYLCPAHPDNQPLSVSLLRNTERAGTMWGAAENNAPKSSIFKERSCLYHKNEMLLLKRNMGKFLSKNIK